MVNLAYHCDYINQDVRRFKVTREEHFFTRFDLFLAIVIILSITYEVRNRPIGKKSYLNKNEK